MIQYRIEQFIDGVSWYTKCTVSQITNNKYAGTNEKVLLLHNQCKWGEKGITKAPSAEKICQEWNLYTQPLAHALATHTSHKVHTLHEVITKPNINSYACNSAHTARWLSKSSNLQIVCNLHLINTNACSIGTDTHRVGINTDKVLIIGIDIAFSWCLIWLILYNTSPSM